MKKFFFLAAISVSIILSACSDSVQDISPVSPQLSKTGPDISYPFRLYQSFPEISNVKIKWERTREGLLISVQLQSRLNPTDLLFAVIEFLDVDFDGNNQQMVYLGHSSVGTYLINGIRNRSVRNIKIYVYQSGNLQDKPQPYTPSELFNLNGVNGWSSGGDVVKVSSYKFSARMKHLYAELTSKEGNQLVFLGKPGGEDFDFPVKPTGPITDLRLFGYNKITKALNNLTADAVPK